MKDQKEWSVREGDNQVTKADRYALLYGLRAASAPPGSLNEEVPRPIELYPDRACEREINRKPPCIGVLICLIKKTKRAIPNTAQLTRTHT